jgi:hypothetical protein
VFCGVESPWSGASAAYRTWGAVPRFRCLWGRDGGGCEDADGAERSGHGTEQNPASLAICCPRSASVASCAFACDDLARLVLSDRRAQAGHSCGAIHAVSSVPAALLPGPRRLGPGICAVGTPTFFFGEPTHGPRRRQGDVAAGGAVMGRKAAEGCRTPGRVAASGSVVVELSKAGALRRPRFVRISAAKQPIFLGLCAEIGRIRPTAKGEAGLEEGRPTGSRVGCARALGQGPPSQASD